MLKIILSKIKQTEDKKKKVVDKQLKLQSEIDKFDLELKKLNSYKKEYEKLEKNVTEFLEKKANLLVPLSVSVSKPILSPSILCK